MKETFTETIQRYFAKRQKQVVIDRILEQLKLSFDKQAHELANKLYENYRVDIMLKEKEDGTLAATTIIHTDNLKD